jgi:hypothetical protein
MGLRFQKRIRLFKGLTLNLSKTGASFSLGGRGARVNIRGNKVTGTVGIPGTGLSYRERLDKPTERPEVLSVEQEAAKPINGWKILAFFLAIVVFILLMKQ